MRHVLCFGGHPDLLRLIQQQYFGVYPIISLPCLKETLDIIGVSDSDETRKEFLSRELERYKEGIIIVLGLKNAEEYGCVENHCETSHMYILKHHKYNVGENFNEFLFILVINICVMTYINRKTFLDMVGRVIITPPPQL
jgi:hypothetical protein